MLWDMIILLILVLFGIGLILLEIFFIPGFGAAGVGGVIFMGGAVWYAYEQLGTTAGNITLLCSIAALIASFYWFIKSKTLSRMALQKKIDSTAPNMIPQQEIASGDSGITLSVLNPIGKVLINGKIVEAKSELNFIEVNRPIVVISVFTTNILVKEQSQQS